MLDQFFFNIPLDQSDDIYYDDMIQYDMTINHIRHAMIYHDVKICMCRECSVTFGPVWWDMRISAAPLLQLSEGPVDDDDDDDDDDDEEEDDDVDVDDNDDGDAVGDDVDDDNDDVDDDQGKSLLGNTCRQQP